MKLAGAEARLLIAPVGEEPFEDVVPLVGAGMAVAGAVGMRLASDFKGPIESHCDFKPTSKKLTSKS